MAESSLFPTETHLPGMDAAISALEAAGWVCVPKEPTEGMLAAARDHDSSTRDWYDISPDGCENLGLVLWRAMLTASNPKEKPMGSPQAPASEDTDA